MLGYTVKNSLSPWEIPWDAPSGFLLCSGYILPYIPPLVIIQIQYIPPLVTIQIRYSTDLYVGMYFLTPILSSSTLKIKRNNQFDHVKHCAALD